MIEKTKRVRIKKQSKPVSKGVVVRHNNSFYKVFFIGKRLIGCRNTITSVLAFFDKSQPFETYRFEASSERGKLKR